MGEGQTMGALGVYGETAYLESACSVADPWIIALFGMEPMEENPHGPRDRLGLLCGLDQLIDRSEGAAIFDAEVTILQKP